MPLNDEQLRRYARSISLPEIGVAGQERLLSSRVLVIGAGALGSAVMSYLATSGIGHLGIVDDDRVELSNLQRQILHETGDIGRLKVESARDRIEELNLDCKLTLYPVRLDNDNVASLVQNYDIVVDGSDNFATRFIIGDACHHAQKPLVSAAIRAFEGQLAVFKSYLGAPHPCYRCLVNASPSDERGCNDIGVLGAMAGILGSMQALQVIKELVGMTSGLENQLILINGLNDTVRKLSLQRDPDCVLCRI